MVGMPSADSATQRARWLAELADALEEARDLVKQLASEEIRFDAVELSARIEAARFEVQSMRLRRSTGGGQDFGPEWSKDIPWKLSA
jgi:acyl-CoA reductase-like NAD-dependent aldehyde dehydrogenase